MITFLEFEKPIAELEGKIEELRRFSHQNGQQDLNISDEVKKLEEKVRQHLQQAYANLLPFQKVQVARHPNRPHCRNYIDELFEEFIALSGDRLFGEDPAIVCGLGRFRGYSVMVIGQEKGNDTESRLHHNFGMARPEGYRKSRRMMLLAARFGLPVLVFIDTPGAYPGVGAEQRGQAEAIASCIETCLRIKVPLIAVIIGEGGSGGAVALATADRVLMLEHAIYSVISPEGCASILWRNAAMAAEAANSLRLTAQDLKSLNVIDRIIPEPLGGAQRDAKATIVTLGECLASTLKELLDQDGATLRRRRREKFQTLGSANL